MRPFPAQHGCTARRVIFVGVEARSYCCDYLRPCTARDCFHVGPGATAGITGGEHFSEDLSNASTELQFKEGGAGFSFAVVFVAKVSAGAL